MTAYKFLRRAPTVVHHKRWPMSGAPSRFDTLSLSFFDSAALREAVRSLADPSTQSAKTRNR